MQKNFKKIRVVLALIFILGFIVAFADIKGILPSWYYITILYLQFTPSFLKFITPGTVLSLGFIFILLLTLLGGRIYCSIICPLGIVQDIIIFFKRKFRPKTRLRYKKALVILRYGILTIAIISLLFSGLLAINLLDPYANFGRMGTHLFQPVILSVNNLLAKLLPFTGLNILEGRPIHVASFSFSLGILALVFVMSVYRGRLYCNSVCPVGTLLGLLSKISVFKININPSTCTKCGKCQFVCKANCINIKTRDIDNSRCIACYNCIPVCDDSSIGYKRLTKKKPGNPGSFAGNRRLMIAGALTYLATRPFRLFSQDEKKDQLMKDDASFYDRGNVTPPGSQSLEHLHDRCISCHLCVSSCPTKVLQPSFLEYGFTGMMMPKMDYFVNFCNYECTMCGEVCPTGAILHIAVEDKKLTQLGKVKFEKNHCIVITEGTSCGSCSEHCPTQAVKMIPYKDGLTLPETDASICVGCGACEYACPVKKPHKAIFVVANRVHQKAEKPKTKKIEYKETEDFPF